MRIIQERQGRGGWHRRAVRGAAPGHSLLEFVEQIAMAFQRHREARLRQLDPLGCAVHHLTAMCWRATERAGDVGVIFVEHLMQQEGSALLLR